MAEYLKKGPASYEDAVKRDAERFWLKVDKSDHPLGCWIWTGTRSVHGRGNYNVTTYKGAPIGEGRATVQAHVYAYILTFGSRPLGHGEGRGSKGVILAHKCDNGHNGCCNPYHLIPTSQGENLSDKYRAGTHASAVQRKDRILLKQLKKQIGIPERTAFGEIAEEIGVNDAEILKAAIEIYENWIYNKFNVKVSFDFNEMAIKTWSKKLQKKVLA